MKAPSVPLQTRRQFLVRSGLAGVALVTSAPRLWAKGPADPFDAAMNQFMAERKIPGGSLAVVKDRRLVFARGYGWADRDKQEPVKPESLFRIASISKSITAVAIMKLVETGKLELDAPVTKWIDSKPVIRKGEQADPRIAQITIRHCLHHTGGWDRDKSGDPMFRSTETARAVGMPEPARQEAIIRYMLGKPLDFAPGQRYAYSNFGYCLLGRVIEKISGLSYEKFVQQQVLARAKIRRMRLGASLENERAEGEVKYYTPNNRQGTSVFPSHPGKVPAPYGSFCLEAMDSHGGWLASAVDLARFAAALDAPENACLNPKSLGQLYEPPAPPVGHKPDGTLADHFYGCGWDVRPIKNGKANYWHNGSLPGTFTMLVRRWDGLSWAVLFNQRSEGLKVGDGAIDGAMHRAADAVEQWPEDDLFARYVS
jgi:N-acyl-D-amino-acid deacylase